MNLLRRTAFTWLEPASPAERRALARLDEIRAILKETPEPAAEPGDDPGTAAALAAEAAKIEKSMAKAGQWRITVTTANVLAMAQREAYMREAHAWYREHFDEKDADDLTPAEIFERNFVFNTLRTWAMARALTVGIEERQISRLDLDNDAGWKGIGRPDWLETPAGFLGQIPDQLADAWHRAMLEVNPGIFDGAEPDDEKKRYGGASATK